MSTLLDELARGADAVAAGAFTLDRDKAKEKLRHFQLADPCAWLLEVVRAATVLGATWLDVETDTDDVRVAFDGAPFSAEDVEELYAALLARSAPPARAHLAVALNAAMALEPRFIRMESAEPTGAGVRIELRPAKADVITPLPASKAARAATTTLHVRQPFRAGHFVQFFRALAGTQREIVALRTACRFSTLRVRVNGKAIQRGAPGISASAGGQARGQLVLLHRGVVLEEVSHPLVPVGAVVVLEGTGLTRDASLQAFLRDIPYRALLDAAFGKVLEHAEDAHALGRARAAAAFGEPMLALERGVPSTSLGDMAAWPSLSRALHDRERPSRTTPLFVDVRGGVVTINDLSRELAAHGQVLFARRDSQAAALPRTFVHLLDEEESARLFSILGAAAEDGEALLRAAEVRAQQAAKLAERRARTALPPDEYLARVPLEGAFRGELALRRYGSTQLVISWFTDGCLVCTDAHPCLLPGLSLAIEGRFTLTDSFDGIMRDRAFVDALMHAWQQVPALLAALPAQVEPEALERVRAIAAPFLLWSASPTRLRRLFLTELERTRKLAIALPQDEQLAAPTPVSLQGPKAHPLTRMPLVRRADGELTSIEALCRQERITVIPPEIKLFGVAHAIPAGETLRTVLSSLRPLDVQDEAALREAQRARIRSGPVAAKATAGELPVSFRHQTLSGTVSLSDTPGTTLLATLGGRAWCSVSLSDTVGPLRLHVDDPDALPLKDGGIDPDDVGRLARAALTAMPELVERVVTDGRAQPRARKLLLSVLEAPLSHPALRAAADVLDTEAFLAVLRLAEDYEPEVFSSLLELALEMGKPPRIEVLRALHTELQLTNERTRANDAALTGVRRALRFSVMLFGGEHALVNAHAGHMVRAMFARLPALERIPLRTLAGRVEPLASVFARSLEGPISYVPTEVEGAEDLNHVVLDDAQRTVLERVLGEGKLVDKTDEVRRTLAQRAFQQRPREDGRLGAGPYVLVQDFSDGPTTGQIGLVAPRSTEPLASVRVLRDGRFVTRFDLSGDSPCSFAAVIDDPELPLTQDLQGIASPGALARLVSILKRAAEQALDTLAAEATADREALHARAPRAGALLLQRLAESGRAELAPARKHRLLALPIVESARGGWLSVLALRTAAKTGNAAVLSTPARLTAEDDALCVAWAPDTTERDLLRRAVGAPLKDAQLEWMQAAALRSRKAALPALPVASSESPVQISHSEGDVRLCMWLTLGPAAPVVHVGAEGRTVQIVPLDVPLRGLTGWVDAPSWIKADWRVVDDKDLRRLVDAAGVELARLLCAAALAGDPIAELEARDLVIALARRNEKLRSVWRTLFEELRLVALFPVTDGARVSLADALITRPDSLTPLLITAGLLPAEEAVLAEAPPVAAPLPSPVAVVVDVTAALRARIEETLALVKLEDHAASELLRWPLVIEPRGADGPAVELVAGRTRVNAEHALVVRSLDVSQDPAPFFLLCALVYGATNGHLQEVTPAHERAFLARLLMHALSAR